MRYARDIKNNINGVILLEVMSSVFIAALLVAVLTKTYLSMQYGYVIQSSLHTNQIQANNVALILKTEIHRAGQIGCRKLSKEFKAIPYRQHSLTTENKIIIESGTITVSYQSFPGSVLTTPMRSKMRMNLDLAIKFHNNQLLLISDCQHAEIFKVAHVTYEKKYQIITTVEPLHFIYDDYAEVGLFVRNNYHILPSGFVRTDIYNKNVRLVGGIQNMKIHNDEEGIYLEFDSVVKSIKKHWFNYFMI